MVSIATLNRLQKRNTINILTVICLYYTASPQFASTCAVNSHQMFCSDGKKLRWFHRVRHNCTNFIFHILGPTNQCNKNQINITRHRSKLIHGSVESVRIMKQSLSWIFQSLFLNGNMLGQLWRYSVQIPLHSMKGLCVLDGRKSLE